MMPLYRVTFTETGGYRVSCRLRAGSGGPFITLAVKKVWGPDAVWVPQYGTGFARVYRQVGADEDDLVPLTGPVTVAVERVQRRAYARL